MTYVISDVHGCFHTLVKLIQKVRDYDEEPSFVFVGDYVDRGLKNKEAVDYVVEMREQGAVCLRGNHDNVVDWLLNGNYVGHIEEYIVGPVTERTVYQWWLVNGFFPTLTSYGVTAHLRQYGPYGGYARPEEVLCEFRDKVPDIHKEFFRSLPLYWEIDTHFACHAYMRPGEKLPRDLKFMPTERADETLWQRFETKPFSGGLQAIETKWDKIGVFGHTPTMMYGSPTPIKFDRIRLIDTGAFRGEYLCAYSTNSDDYLLQSTDSRDIENQ